MMETGPYNADEVAHVKKCAPLLPDPGGYVASRLLDTIDALVKERDEERRNHNHYGQLWLDVRRERDAATARADKAEKDRDDAMALAKAAASCAESYASDDQVGCLCVEECYCRAGLLNKIKADLARIDDALNRKGGDGEAAAAQTPP